MGPRHSPLVSAFMNGTVEGDDVWIPMDSILGGQEKCGFGWHMFVECLAEGRGVSLPAGAVTAGRMGAVIGAYARVRKQFKVNNHNTNRNYINIFIQRISVQMESHHHHLSNFLIIMWIYRCRSLNSVESKRPWHVLVVKV